MNKKLFVIFLFFSLFLFYSCMHTRTSPASMTRTAGIKIISGNSVLRINGTITENLYHSSFFENPGRTADYYEKPDIRQGAVTKNETKKMTTGQEYKFSVLPAEVVTINIRSLDGNDVELIVYQYGKEEKYIIAGTDRIGLFLSFQNR